MRDASKYIRIGIVNALAGLSVIDDLGNEYSVPVYDGKAPADAKHPRIIITSLSGPGGNSRFSKCHFGGQWSVQMKASMFYQGDMTKNLVDDIADAVLQLLCPKNPPYMNLSPFFNVWDVDAVPGPHQQYMDEVGFYVDKNISITYSLTEN